MRPHFWLLLLSGCAVLPPDYEWHRTSMLPATSYEWNVVRRDDLYKVCGINPPAMPALGACAFNLQQPRKCHIFSHYTEASARVVFSGDGESLWDHEMRHCAGWDHQDKRRK